MTDSAGEVPPDSGSPRRRVLRSVAAVSVLGLAAVSGWRFLADSGDASPGRAATPSPDSVDELPAGVELVDKGFAVHPPRGGSTKPLLGAGTRLSNTREKPMWITVVYAAMGASGRAVADAEGEDVVLNPGGKAFLPAGVTLDFGSLAEVSTEAQKAVRDIAVTVLVHDDHDEVPLITGEVTKLKYQSGAKPGLDYVSFEASNEGATVTAPDYCLVYRDTEGGIVGGWYANRLAWDSIEEAMPADETDEYPAGKSTHTLPVWLTPELKPARVSLHLW